MDRTVPTTESEEIELYQRTYFSLLRSSAEVRIRTLEEVHAGMNSVLHPAAREPYLDMSALIYSLLRLPDVIFQVSLVVMGQSTDVFTRAGFSDFSQWEEVYAQARRRRSYFDGSATLASIIASRSDIDDLIPLLTTLQIEWNKLHQRLGRAPGSIDLANITADMDDYYALADFLEAPVEDLDRLYAILGDEFGTRLQQIASKPCNLRVQMLSGSLSEYRRATHHWWDLIEEKMPEIRQRPVYFVSSNVHSILNIISGFPLQHEYEILEYLKEPGNSGLLNEWNDIQAGRVPSNLQNFYYYVSKKLLNSPRGAEMAAAQGALLQKSGIVLVPSLRSFDVEAQIYDLSRFDINQLDPRLRSSGLETLLPRSDALILNIDYPLGMAAYNILSEVSEHVGSVLGVYVMGKAASLNAVVGDVMISNVVHDEHSQNTYLFPNCLRAADVAPYLVYGTVLDNQKAVTVQGTFLQNTRYMDVFYREGYTDIEMEAGPYLSAVFEMFRPQRHPINEIVNLYGLSFDLGILHYASDAPMNKGRNLGAGSLSYYGMDSTYASSLAVIQRILDQENDRLS